MPTAPKQPSQHERTKHYAATLEYERLKREKEFELHMANVDRGNLQAQLNAKIAVLQARKANANNNLAGATLEQSIASEMQAITTDYQGRMMRADQIISNIQRDLDKLKPPPPLQ